MEFPPSTRREKYYLTEGIKKREESLEYLEYKEQVTRSKHYPGSQVFFF